MKKKEEIGFQLVGIKTEQFALLEDNYIVEKPISILTRLEFKMNNSAKLIGTFADFNFEQDKKSIVKIQISCHFSIQTDSWKNLIKDESSNIIIPKDFLTHLAMLTVGTTRGILFAKTEGTEFAKILLPPINVTAIVKNDAEFEIGQQSG